jgi:hypothetical protein
LLFDSTEEKIKEELIEEMRKTDKRRRIKVNFSLGVNLR